MAYSTVAVTGIHLDEILSDAKYWIKLEGDVDEQETITEIENQMQAGLTLFSDAGESDNDDQDQEIYGDQDTDEFKPDNRSAYDLMDGSTSSKLHGCWFGRDSKQWAKETP